MRRRPHVALLIETSNAYARGILEGISAFAREHGGWAIYLSEHGRGEAVPAWLRGWKGDGILARVENRRIARAVAACALPVVDVSAARLLPRVPWVETDNELIARAALDHLLERGYRQVAFCGLTNFNWSRWRFESFRKLAKAAGCDFFSHMIRGGDDRASQWAADQKALAAWVKRLPRPIGVLACFDPRGRQLLDACRTAGVRVPDDVAVIGVDNDSVLCDLADPPMSSVIPDTRRTGYLAAELLAELMAGKKLPPREHPVAPLGIATRRSTDALAIGDADVSAAVRFIREHACEGISVEAVLDVVPVSRRILESRFSRLLGRTPHQEILRCRLSRAQSLLGTTDLPLKAVAERSGFAHAEYLSVVFKRMTGQSPGAFRTQSRRLRHEPTEMTPSSEASPDRVPKT